MSTHKGRVRGFFAASFMAALPAFAADDGTGNDPCPQPDPKACQVPENAILPDLMTVVPKHLGIQNQQQREILRFSNGLANLGEGPWWLAPEFPDPNAAQCQTALQIFAGAGTFDDLILPTVAAGSCAKGNFDFHETHNHWHIDNIGEFKVCTQAAFASLGAACPPATTSFGTPSQGIKFTFCLIDWYKLGENTASSDPTRNFFDCSGEFQGITPGWVDQYHHATEGQQIDITGLPVGQYVLVSTVNVSAVTGEPVFEETDVSNNTSYVRFRLSRDSKGNPKIGDLRGACQDPDYRAAVEAAAANFVAVYGGDATRLADDMCGGKTSNR